MATPPTDSAAPQDPVPGELSGELSLAGAVVDKAIEYLAGQGIPEVATASALLGGALALLARSVGDEAIVRILNNAIASVRAGEMRDEAGGKNPAGGA